MLITNSMAKTFTQCRKLYEYKWTRGFVPKTAPVPMKRGSWLHTLLEAHYSGVGWRKAMDKELLPSWNKLFDEEKDMYGSLPEACINIMESYEYWYRDLDKEFEVVAVEEVFEVPLPHGHIYQGKFDMLIEDDWGRWLWENKTHARIPSTDFRFMDIQTARYLWALNKLGTYGEINGIVWNYIRTKPPTVPKQNKDGRLSKRKIETDLFTFVKTLKNYGLDLRHYRDDIIRLKGHNPFFSRERTPRPDNVVRTLVKELVVVADEIERGYQPVRKIDYNCERCMFLEPCLISLYEGDEESVLKSRFEKGDPLTYHGYAEEVEDQEI